jgi:uncharacterized HAD superfamily protein
MKIGIDFDGTIVKVDEANRTRISDALMNEYGIKIANPNTNIWGQRYEGNPFTNKEFENEFLGRYFRAVAGYEMTAAGAANLSPMPNAVECIKRLKELKHELHLITARGFDECPDSGHSKEVINIVNSKLNELGLVFDQYHFGNDSKVKIAQELGLDLMIDDKYSVIRQLSANSVPVIQLISPNSKSQRYAIDIKGAKIATDWNEIVAEVERQTNKSTRKLHRLSIGVIADRIK